MRVRDSWSGWGGVGVGFPTLPGTLRTPTPAAVNLRREVCGIIGCGSQSHFQGYSDTTSSQVSLSQTTINRRRLGVEAGGGGGPPRERAHIRMLIPFPF